MANTSILAAFERMWQHITSALSNKSDISHDHNEAYDAKGSASSALTSAKSYTDEKFESIPSVDTYTKTEIDSALANKSNTSHNHDEDYDAIGSADKALTDAKAYTDTVTSGKANTSHTHDDRYYTETEIDSKLSTKASTSHNHDSDYDAKGSASAVQANLDTVNDTLDTHTGNTDIHVTTFNKSNWNTAYTHSQSTHARTDATKVADSTTNGNILINGSETNVYTHPNSGVTAGTYKSVTVNSQGHITAGTNPTTLAGYGITDAETKGAASSALASAKEYTDSVASGKASTTHNHDSAYDTKGAAASALASAKTYADSAATTAANTVKNDLLNGAGGAYDTLKELGDLIDDNTDAIDALETVAANKADKSHTHTIANVSGLQSALDGKAASSHGTHVSYSTTAPVMDGTASVGTASTVARSDHKHPTDTSRASKTEFDSHTSNTTAHITSAERSNWNAAKTHADSAHAPSNAQPNQNAFSNITVGSTTVAADTATDTVTFVGSNVTITPDATNDKITFAVADASTSAKGIVQLTNSTSSTSTTTAATPNSVKSAYDLANQAKTAAAAAQTTADGKVPTSRTINGKALSDNISISKGDVGLGNVDNTADADKSVAGAKSLESDSYITSAEAMDNFLTGNKLKYATFKFDEDIQNLGFGSNDGMLLSIPWMSDTYGTQIAFDDTGAANIAVRGKSTTWGSWYKLIHSSNYTNYVPTKDGAGATGTWGINITGSATSAGSATTLSGLTASVSELNYVDGVTSNIQTQLNGKQSSYVMSPRDCTQGTLITTNIDYSVDSGNSFYLEIIADTYGGSSKPLFTQAQGYIYDKSIIHYGMINHGYEIPELYAMNVNGVLCFWFPRMAYWQSFGCRVYKSNIDYKHNCVVSVTDSSKPNGTKVVSLHTTKYNVMCFGDNASTATKATQDGSGNVITSTYLPKSGGTMTGKLQVNAVIMGYNYANNNNAPAFVFDKSGSNYTGIGANGEADTILFAPVSSGDYSWVSNYKQKWKFQGDVIADNITGNLNGNASTATKATQDGNGNTITSTYLPLSGGTMSGNLSLTEAKNILLRPTNTNYTAGIGYDTYGNECIALWAKNSVTRLRWYAGKDMTSMNSGAMMEITPDFEVDKSSGSVVGRLGGNTIIHSGNIGSQSVNYATSAGSASSATTATTLSGLTAAVSELNYTDGVTSNIQTQLNSKAPAYQYGTSDIGTGASLATGQLYFVYE